MEIINVPISELKANERNPRKITKKELKKLSRSLEEFGFVDPIIVNKHPGRENIVVGGHQRLKAAESLGLKEVPVTYVDLDKFKEEQLNIALNKISGEWDEERLNEIIQDLIANEQDVTLTGFDEPDIEEFMSKLDQEEKDERIDEVPTIPEEPKVTKGEVWKLGKHRLMVGDSTNEQDFKTLMNGKIADACWTDPPYGVSYVGTNNPNGKDWGMLVNDNLRGDKLFEFLLAIYRNVAKHTKENPSLFTCYASINHLQFENALQSAGFEIKQQLIWEKGHVLGHSDYHWCHEPILYCRKIGKNNEWFGDRKHKTVILNSTIEDLEKLKKEELIEMLSQIRRNSDIISEKKDAVTEYLHSTQKPVKLSQRMIKNTTRPGEIVIEPCCGSGSTLMACQTSGRICYAMEIDEKYAEVIIERYAKYTGLDPERESDGKKWSELNKKAQDPPKMKGAIE